MAKVVAFPVLATAFVILIITSRINKHNSPSIFGLNRRLGYTFPIPTFDPLVVKIQRAAEAKGLIKKGNPIGSEERNSNIVVETENAYEYLSENGTLNMTLRLMFIFPLLDNASKDGKVSFEELQQWNKEQAIERLTYRTDKEMELHDKDGDGMINFSEYLPQFSKEDIDENSTAHGEAGWWMLQFKNADIDQNGFLDYDEFNDFLHPEDTNNDKIQRWMLREKIRLMDDDGDGKLNFAEFSMHVYSIYKIYGEFEASRSNLATAKEKFEELDTNKDEFLEVKELLPILCYLKPGELSYAKYYASYLIQEADDNGDNYLTLDEMLNHENTFYTTMYDNDDYDDDFHDEL
ncbi:Reticulocalbin-2 precursor, putative [Ricinus communis]|uniref:Reticulocalbin-2, putative n=1 Tax=Ricinus communis TaxID=3988 RepID=B9SJT5_RICCO|nr:Reticulocalbin-2 precursor, putative [Ricinus communis]|eukprot:XP_002526254.1 calumenin-B [Ricinus communis]